MFVDEDAGKPEAGPPISNNEPKHVPPWERRKRFLDAMKDAHDKNRIVYFNTLGAQGYESTNDVPAEADKEAEILSVIQSEIPG